MMVEVEEEEEEEEGERLKVLWGKWGRAGDSDRSRRRFGANKSTDAVQKKEKIFLLEKWL